MGNTYKALLHKVQARLSLSRRGGCDDNTQAENRLKKFGCQWSRLKTEEPEARDWPVFTNLADAQVSAATYFDYHSHDRRYSHIGYSNPYQFHQQQLINIT